MNKASFVFSFDTSQTASLIVQTLSPEMCQSIPKTRVELTLQKNKVFLTIATADVSSLRAACNSYLRWMQTAIDITTLV
jgi:tRNA threonylcarbamoyladenosine modification (KEOPS) complex  Pcc1 subunit